VALAYAYLYDKRGRSIELEFKEDQQGFGLAKRNKKRYEAQQMVLLLSALAHSVVVWSGAWLAASVSKVEQSGVLRMVRDVFAVSGLVEIGAKNSITRIVLSSKNESLKLLRCNMDVSVTIARQTPGDESAGDNINHDSFLFGTYRYNLCKM
jgi:hypothetical protein